MKLFGQLRPKVVLVGLFIGNDFWDAEMFDLWFKSGAGGSYMIWRDFADQSALVSTCNNRYKIL
jgi:hypothetical protein